MEKIKKILKDNFIIIYCIFFIATFLNDTTFIHNYKWLNLLAKVIRYATYILFLLRLTVILPDYKKDLSKKKWKEKMWINKFAIIIGIIFMVSALINFITTKSTRMILILLIVLASYKVDYKKIIKLTMILQVTLISATVLASTLGIIGNFAFKESTGRLKYSLGFSHSNNLAQMIMLSSLLYCFCKKNNVSYVEIFTLQILNCFTLFITGSKTSFIILESIILSLLLYNMLNKYNIFNKIAKCLIKFFVYTFPVYPIIFLILVLMYPYGGIITSIDRIFTNRISLPYNMLEKYGVSLFGEGIEFVGNGINDIIKYGKNITDFYNFVDNIYIQMVLKEGVIIAILFIIIMYMLIIMMYKSKKYRELFVCTIYLILGLIEPKVLSLVYSPIVFLVIPIFSEYFNVKK